MVTRRIRIQLSKNSDWVLAQLLQIGDGWVEVETERSPLWVMFERCHPDDLREFTRKRAKTKTKQLSPVDVEEYEKKQKQNED